MAWRNLKRNASTAIPRRIVFLDTETIREPIHNEPLRFNHHLRCGAATYVRIEKGKVTRRHDLFFDDNAQWWRWLACVLDDRATTWIVAHKASFDMGVVGLWEQLDKGIYCIDAPRAKRPVMNETEADDRLQRGLCIIDDPPFILGLRFKSGARLVVVDTLNWFRMSLAEMGRSLKLEKLPMPDNDAPINEWKIYNRRDVEILEKAFLALIDFAQSHDVGMFRYTAPAQAMSMFRHKHMHHKIVMHDETAVKKLERAAYYGGETRYYFLGEINEPIYQLDVNGLYPFVMRQCEFPRKLTSWNKSRQTVLTMPDVDVNSMVATVRLASDTRTYPLRDDHGTTYARGQFITTLAGPELSFAYHRGDILEWRNWANYTLAPLFQEYVNNLFELRLRYAEQNNPAFALLCKLLLNSLYGKFGQRSYKWRQLLGKIPARRWARWLEINFQTGGIELHRSIGDCEFASTEPGEHRESFPAIAAFVTSWGRQYMRWLRALIGESNCYYQATDSLVVNGAGLLNASIEGLLNEQELGKLKIVAEGDSGEICGMNHYRIGGKHVRSGVRRNAQQTKPQEFLQELFENAESQVARFPTNAVQSWQTVFRQRQPVCRGYVGKDGRVEPLRLSDPADMPF